MGVMLVMLVRMVEVRVKVRVLGKVKSGHSVE